MSEQAVEPEKYLTNLEKILERAYPFGIVPRHEIGKATNGLLNPRTLATRDCLGTGIKSPITIERKIHYYIPEIINYLRIKTQPQKQEAA